MAALSGSLTTDWPFEAPAVCERRERQAAWIRGILAALLVFALPTSAGETPRRDGASGNEAPPAGEAWREAADAVRLRFTLAGAVRDCRHTENLYGFNLLLAAVDPGERTALEGVARDAGRTSVAGPADEKTCLAALQDLDAADDGLVLLAERAGRNAR